VALSGGPTLALSRIVRGADVRNHSDAPPAAGLTRALSLFMIALMLGAIAYAAWITIRYWKDIGV
jgi:hypothetical protein